MLRVRFYQDLFSGVVNGEEAIRIPLNHLRRAFDQVRRVQPIFPKLTQPRRLGDLPDVPTTLCRTPARKSSFLFTKEEHKRNRSGLR